jgi:transposase
MPMMPHQRSRFIGLDVHSATISVAVADGSERPSSYGRIANDPAAVRKLMARLGGPDVRLRVAYEAGPTGYALHRQLTALGIECMVVAPSLIPMRPGDKVKTDRRDALKLARLLRSGDLTPVWVPDEAHEALRNLVRARADAKVDELRARHRLSKFLLRQGCRPPIDVRNWSYRYQQWLGQLRFAHVADRSSSPTTSPKCAPLVSGSSGSRQRCASARPPAARPRSSAPCRPCVASAF